jgi:predicted P-loop ATPase
MLISGLDSHTRLDDAAVDKLWLTIDEKYRFLPPRDFFLTVVAEAARRNSHHPVCEYLNGLKWDGVPRIDSWLVDYVEAEATEYVCAVGAITLVAAVCRVRHPGCKFDEMLILECPRQGGEKSTVLASLAVQLDWFSDDFPLNADGKKVIEQTRGKWIVEASDMSGMRKADVEHLKAMLSRQSDRGRLAYDRLTSEQPRQFIVIGTTNDEIYLKDVTGNRRFWPVKVATFDIARITRDRDQLWAEAAAREATGVSIRLEQSLWDAAAEAQSERAIEDPWFEQIANVLGDLKGKLLAKDAWEIVGMRDESRRNQEHNLRLGRAMKKLGFERKVLNFDGKVQRGYAKGTECEQMKRILVVRDHVWAELEEKVSARGKRRRCSVTPSITPSITLEVMEIIWQDQYFTYQ